MTDPENGTDEWDRGSPRPSPKVYLLLFLVFILLAVSCTGLVWAFWATPVVQEWFTAKQEAAVEQAMPASLTHTLSTIPGYVCQTWKIVDSESHLKVCLLVCQDSFKHGTLSAEVPVSACDGHDLQVVIR